MPGSAAYVAVRFGPAGKEKPGIIDAKGKIRDLSKIVKDIDGEALSPAGLAKIKKAKIEYAFLGLRIHAAFLHADCGLPWFVFSVRQVRQYQTIG